ncbi:MAG TPA: hypothetical protein VMM18_07630 [Gemmatimonadaceae bacterium]|nr:hypothetical protein [Gemmatimonadaceae bacterium]
MRSLILASLALLLAGASAAAQLDARLEARLDARTAADVQSHVDAAAAAGLPVEPLVLKALEGASKGARGPQIAGAVARLHTQFVEARGALGPRSAAGEIVAAASAMQAGASAETLRQMRAARRDAPLTTALTVLADLIAYGVPVADASTLLIELVRAGARDDQLTDARGSVQKGIGAGLSPAAAAQEALSGPPAALPVTPGAPAGSRPPVVRPPTP